MSYIDLSIREIHKALLDKKVTPLELTKEALARAKDNDDNCFESILEEEALRQAESLTDIKEGDLLYGIPFLNKDNFSTKGIETTASSNILNGYKPLFDSEVNRRLKQANAVMIAKTTLDELAMGGSGTTGHKGITYNPYSKDHSRMVGGSSSGSAAGLAAGIGVFATGSDTGDSVRRPASLAGLVGVKPTWGRISRFGLFPFAPSLDHVGYFTRYVDDAALLLNYLAGHDEKDFTSSYKQVDDYLARIDEGVKGKKLFRIKEIEDSLSDKRLLGAIDKLSETLIKQGAEVDIVSFPKDLLESLYATYIVISCAEATSNDANLDGIKFGPYYQGRTYQESMKEARTKGFSELIRRRFVIGSFALMKENQDVLFLRAQKNRAKVVDYINKIFLKGYDAYIVPAASSVAPLFGQASDKLSDEYLIADNHLCLANFSGMPSLSLPLALEDGLPLGVNITAMPFEESKLFAIAKAIENITGLGGLSTVNPRKGNL